MSEQALNNGGTLGKTEVGELLINYAREDSEC